MTASAVHADQETGARPVRLALDHDDRTDRIDPGATDRVARWLRVAGAGGAPQGGTGGLITDRKGSRPAGHLAGLRGVLQVDGYDGFKRLALDRADNSVTLAFCWAHMGRAFYDFHVSTKSPLAAWVLAKVAEPMPLKPRSAPILPITDDGFGRSEGR
jgi:hypothetical protein